jgi:hypothetical protein
VKDQLIRAGYYVDADLSDLKFNRKVCEEAREGEENGACYKLFYINFVQISV